MTYNVADSSVVPRYNVRMAAGRREYGRIKIEHWRKHMHWFSLVRFHAELVVNDTEVSRSWRALIVQLLTQLSGQAVCAFSHCTGLGSMSTVSRN